MPLGEYLRKIRKRKGISLKSLAKKLNVNFAYLSRVENEKVPPSDTLIKKLAKILSWDLDELTLLAGRVPSAWLDRIEEKPPEATERLRVALSSRKAIPCRVAEESPTYITQKEFRKAIEDSFPFEEISEIAEHESWRKEIYRPIYHIHKWWAQRLGSIFRALVIGACAEEGDNILNLFYRPVRYSGFVIYDPFMGSGTTLGEALKLGCRVIGRDINPVSFFAVRNALDSYSLAEVQSTFHDIEADVADRIKAFYKARLPNGEIVDVLYYFWVKTINCPRCYQEVDLFSSHVFAQHAYPDQFPKAKSLCPNCGEVSTINFQDSSVRCGKCRSFYNPHSGLAKGSKATCPKCNREFSIAQTYQLTGHPPTHRMYAKMVLLPNGTKDYVSINDFDKELFEKASKELKGLKKPYPLVAIKPGYNTDQVINYGYTHWHQMFNDRQLLCLSLLAERIKKIKDERLRNLFTCLFSGCLEFNNMFCSFKGEGTGAVRHMFSHHILKPERVPLEANVWGTPKSSGAFSTLYESRLLRVGQYREMPFEIELSQRNGRKTSKKVFGLSQNIGTRIARTFNEFITDNLDLYLSCGSSCNTDIADSSVDAVVTDPPFFDNVHYSQLADFFYVWQRHILGSKDVFQRETTRSEREVQQTDPDKFTMNLAQVYKDCHRVLKKWGLLIFTYHHSKQVGWISVLKALSQAGFYIEASYSIKSEMSVAVPKLQAKEPINLDIIFVCHKRGLITSALRPKTNLIEEAKKKTQTAVERFNQRGRKLSRNDVKVILMAGILTTLSQLQNVIDMEKFLIANEASINTINEEIYKNQEVLMQKQKHHQLCLF
jgi:adenine-specific DNA methylase/DNA-binding XRE family transcriptional regulator